MDSDRSMDSDLSVEDEFSSEICSYERQANDERRDRPSRPALFATCSPASSEENNEDRLKTFVGSVPVGAKSISVLLSSSSGPSNLFPACKSITKRALPTPPSIPTVIPDPTSSSSSSSSPIPNMPPKFSLDLTRNKLRAA
mmetsp:Transcript_13100/g.22064  ORF Transcript_13100/g.22064 Transcript_13100/m.22064 type:complete len:141 (-) Transcript_13100:29-451(-)